ncbi:uncharacterized protein PEZ65_018885 [Lycodopsis pacificus]
MVPPEQQEWSSSLDQEDPEPPHIKEEQEELWTSPEGEQLQWLEEADVNFPFTSVPEKSEDDEEEAQSSQLHQRQTGENREAEHFKTESDGEDCGGSEPARKSDPDSPLQPAAHEGFNYSEPETDDSRDWEESKEPQSDVPVSDTDSNTGKRSICSSECAGSFNKRNLKKHTASETGVKLFLCSVCGKRFARQSVLRRHLTVHTGEKPFSCSVCSKRFAHDFNLRTHLTVHSGEKPFSCSVCSKTFTLKQNLRRHLATHTGEKPFNCLVCGKKFAQKGHLRRHLTVHTGEKPFSCSYCSKKFTQKGDLERHVTVHTGEKPLGCTVCDKRFTRLCYVKNHKCVG